ncbi:MAG: cupin domain-containing protein [Pirellulales bacterium]
MKVIHLEAVDAKPVDMEGARGCTIRWLVGAADGAPNFSMRQFELASGGHTPKHHHPYEHEVFVLEGTGTVLEGDVVHPLHAGDTIYVPPGEVHQFRNTGTSTLKFLCLVPNSFATQQVTTVPDCGSD